MFKVNIDGVETVAEVSFYTAQLYEAEFGSDLIQDLFGKQDDGSGIVEMSGKGDKARVVSIDFTKIGWTGVTKALGAACKTADESVGSYPSWMKEIRGVNMWDVRSQLINEVTDCFFRASAAGEDL